jgi:hypothetical protein
MAVCPTVTEALAGCAVSDDATVWLPLEFDMPEQPAKKKMTTIAVS